MAKYDLPTRDFFKFTTSEGVQLNGWIVKPKNFDPNKKYPVIFYQYSGPGSQQVVDRWTLGAMGAGGIYESYLTQQGFIALVLMDVELVLVARNLRNVLILN